MNKEEQKKLLIETMEADEKDGLYKTNNMAQQTAVNFLVNYMLENFHLTDESLKIFEQAKQMEKEQIIEFGRKVADHWGMTEVPKEYIEQYYNETYGK